MLPAEITIDYLRPTSEYAESGILGTLLIDGDVALERCVGLRSEHFAVPSNRLIFTAIRRISARGDSVDPITVSQDLERDGTLQSVGGIVYLTGLGADLPFRFDPTHLVAEVIDRWRRREAQRVAAGLLTSAGDVTADIGEALNGSLAEILGAVSQREERDEPLVEAYTVESLDRILGGGVKNGLSFGMQDLDDFTGGMQPGQVSVIGAWSGIGKSCEMIQAAHANARNGVPVHLFALELSRHECLCRLYALESGVPYTAIYYSKLGSEQRVQVKAAAHRIADWGTIRIHDRASIDLAELTALARLSIRQHKTQFIAVDYVQNLRGDGKDDRIRVMNISQTLTALAKDEGVHVQMLSQLSKPDGKDPNAPPRISALRETGQLENDGHLVLLLHRLWDEEQQTRTEEASIIVAKNRNGPTRSLRARFCPDSLSFKNV